MTSRIYLKRELANLGVTEGDMKRLKRRRSDKAYEKVARLAIRRLGYYFPTRPLLEYDNEEEKDDDKDMEESDDLQECIRDPAILAIDTAPETADSVERLAQETLRTIAGRLDNAQRLELAWGGPLTFLGREVQLIDVNADEEIFCKPIPTKIESDEIKTLINWAVEVGTSRENVREIVNAYKSQNTQPLDEIWRTLYPSMKPPLHVAVEHGRADLAEELLIAGVDPAVRYSDPDSSPCLYSGIAHHECKGSISGEPSPPPCNDALRLAIACARAQRDRASPKKPSSAEDCVLALLNHGAEIDVFESDSDGDTAPFSRDFSELLALGLARAIHTTVDRIFALAAAHPKRTQLARRLDEVLGRALECLAPPTGEEALIRRLADLGASAAPSVMPAPRYRRLLETALGAAGSGGFQSAVAGLFAGPRASELRHCDDVAASVAQLRLEDAHIGFTWALFAALRDLEMVAAASGAGGSGGRADAFVRDPELTSRELQGRLLARAIDCEALDTVRWLLAQDCPMYEDSDHPLLYVIRNHRLKIARGLLEDNSVGSEGVNVDQILNDRTLLE